MSHPIISVIIPAYNVENYIEHCIESVIVQSYKNLEIIIVNDGSTDDTGETIKRFKDKSIKIITQKNQGLSAARNAGIRQATGEYIALVDGDDAIEPEFIEKLYESIEKHQSEIAVCGYSEILNGIKQNPIDATPRYIEHSGTKAAEHLLLDQDNYQIVAWNKLYAKHLFENIEYPAGETHEDNLTTYKLLSAAKKVSYVSAPLYQYIRRGKSITAKTNIIKRLEIKERAATEAAEYFAEKEKLHYASKIAMLLAKFARLDHAIAGRIPKSNIKSTIKWLKEHKSEYQDNPLLSKKLATYYAMSVYLNAIPYRIFRKVKHS